MKHLPILFGLALCVAGCTTEGQNVDYAARHFAYRGHQYIEFAIRYSPTIRTGVVHDPDCPCHSHTLTEWQMLQLAIAYTESKCNPDAVGASQDLGILQIRPIYAREASRLAVDRVYAHSDALDPLKSFEMFNIVQDHHNPSHDISKAISLHNKADWYKRQVLLNLELIHRIEATREIVLRYE